MEQKTKVLVRMAKFFSHKVYTEKDTWRIVNESYNRYNNGFFRYSDWIVDLENSFPEKSIGLSYGINYIEIKLKS